MVRDAGSNVVQVLGPNTFIAIVGSSLRLESSCSHFMVPRLEPKWLETSKA